MEEGRTFADAFCREYHIPRSWYRPAVFWFSLHRRSILAVPFLKLLDPSHFRYDDALIEQIGRMRRAENVSKEILRWDPMSQSEIHWRWKFRISSTRLHEMAEFVKRSSARRQERLRRKSKSAAALSSPVSA